jgi:peptide deformylase
MGTKDKRRKKLKERAKKRIRYRKKTLSKILTFDAPELYRESAEVNKDENLDFIHKMKAVLAFTKNGVGLAACQIGINKRVFVMRPDPEVNLFQVFINPKIINRSEEILVEVEGCLSYPGVTTPVSRHFSIEIEYLDEKLRAKKETLRAFEARIAQHEIEHFSGKCSIGEAWQKTKQNVE